MLGIHPISAAPLSDIGDSVIGIIPTGVSTANPVVDSAVATINLALAGDDVSASNPVVDTTIAIESTPVVAPDLTMGVPVVDTTAISQVHVLSGVYNGNAILVPNVQATEDEKFSAPNVVTGTVRVDAAVFTQDRIFSSDDFVTGAPDIPEASATLNYYFAGDDVSSGNVEVNTLAMSIVVNFSAPDITSGVPVIDTTNVTQSYPLDSNEIYFTPPIIAIATLTIDTVLQTESFATNFPTIGQGIFPFMESAIPEEVFEEITVVPEIWVDTPPASEKTFTSSPTPSTPSFSSQEIENTDIWSDS